MNQRKHDSLILIGMYLIGIVPGAVIDSLTPAGEQLSWLPLILGVLVGGLIGTSLGWLARRILAQSGYRDVFMLMMLIYGMVWTGPALVRYLNKGLDRSTAPYRDDY